MAYIVFLAVAALVFIGWHTHENKSDMDIKENVIVLLKFKAQPEKGTQAVSALHNLLDQVREEPHFVSIKLHMDPNDATNILLYEEWEDVSYYNTEHMETDHIKEFMANSINFLNGPPEITFWEVQQVYK